MNEKLIKLVEDHLADGKFTKILWVHVFAKGSDGQEVVKQLSRKLRETNTVDTLEDFTQLSSDIETFIVPDLCRNYVYEDIDNEVLPTLLSAKKSYLIPLEIPKHRIGKSLGEADTDLRKIKTLFYQIPSRLNREATVITVSWLTEDGTIKVGLCKNRMAKLMLPFELTK